MVVEQSTEMKTVLAFALLEYFLLSCSLQQFGLAVPTIAGKEHATVVSADAKRGADYRNALFGVYICRVKKAADAVDNKLQVRFLLMIFLHTCNHQ